MAQDDRTAFRNLNDRRELAGIQWAAVCRKAGVAYTTVWRALSEGNVPRAETLGKIDAALTELIDERVANLKRLNKHG